MKCAKKLCAAIALSLGAPEAFAAAAPSPHIALEQQAADLPNDFIGHFFNVPLAVRVTVQGEYLGDAMAVLSARDTVTLLRFTDSNESPWPDSVRTRILGMLHSAQPLGTCIQARCPTPWRRLTFDRSSSTLDIVTVDAMAARAEERHAEVPTSGSGVIVNQRINAAHDGHGDASGRYWIDVLTSKHGWTTTIAAQHQRVATNGTNRPVAGTTRLQHAYVERQVKRHFVRVGAFYPDTIGLYQQPLLIGARAQNVLGIMLGSSDVLDDTIGTPSAQPMFVTATRPGLVEIYRNGTLVHTQPVKAGLQPVDTAPLPGGIYAVELRVVEDGTVTSSIHQWVYKPTLWTNTQRRWRYNAFAGRQLRGAPGDGDFRRDGPAYGAAANVLLHPRFILGLSATGQADGHAAAVSFTAQPTERSMLHANIYRASKTGHGGDIQFNINTTRANLGLSYGDTWIVTPSNVRFSAMRRRTWSFAGSLRPNRATTLNLRLAGRKPEGGVSYDLAVERLFAAKSGSTLVRASVFDRPLLLDKRPRRNRGFELNATLALSAPVRAWSATVGQHRDVDRRNETYARVDYRRSAEGSIPLVNGDISADRHGVGAAGGVQFLNRYLRGDVFAARSSLDGQWAGGLNMDTTLALGAGHTSIGGAPGLRFAQSMMAIDVDGESPGSRVRAIVRDGESVLLRPGRNLVAVQPFVANRVNFDVEGSTASTTQLDRRAVDFRANAGDVLHAKVSMTQTVTALGRLMDAAGRPLAGAVVTTSVDRTVTEASGVFSLAIAKGQSTLTASRDEQDLCTVDNLRLNLSGDDDLAMLGDVVCKPSTMGIHP
ncbi:TcfC E-set like domain-containing protein [Pinirhizobacter soli]|uniref:TcfC E-set like domain-containing protein n=1 Tax=Pinirhizobacter soli TaxID=2786953 RepID=UPI00202A819C|nr:TcfC E-set like domain-containing protein [Pinirhizobacter soli]